MKKLGREEATNKIKSNIKKIEKEWNKQIKIPHGGGLDSVTNRKYAQLKLALEKIT